jgi:tRNA wybutosine-synthesizing protein 1
MVTPAIRASLTKQGYRVIGSHSGVKLCRWTKSMLRGRGGCYKNALYGIQSHRCMEATPSLACANKCTFCWRHHSNPVGKEWKWAMDGAEEIVATALSEHASMVKQLRGVPGVLPERVLEGMTPAHCALSLVGEPIMYPRINELVGLLHDRGISTFLVTNAQFPDAIRALRPVTQLYVSVDAATPEALKAVDRPLFADFWTRFTDSLLALRDKQQRTVYRLTLVQGANMGASGCDATAYAKLVSLGQPDFIELKGVTYCGTGSGAGGISMSDVPYHQDVVTFARQLGEAVGRLPDGGEYGLACEHAHSCCVLLARRDRFWRDGGWWTHIDYTRFNALALAGQPFCSADYMARTPDWACAGSAEAGFDPAQTRFKKVRNHPGKEAAAEAA